MERYDCANCGHHFEHEEQETVICPSCFWSSSVQKEQKDQKELKEQKEPKGIHREPPKSVSTLTFPREEPNRLWPWAVGILSVFILAGVALFAFSHLRKQDEILHKIETKNAQVIATQAPELKLSKTEQDILARSIPLNADRPLTENETALLAPRLPIRSRNSTEGIATPPWDQKQFEAFLKETQAQYKIPLEWSYRRKLIQLFRNHYLAAAAAFEAKDFLKARDEWIRSLAFPVYHNDIRKHEGVVLTMLRPFINDTLSKIGAMNASLMGSQATSQQDKIRAGYQTLTEFLDKKSWDEANAKILEIQKLMEGIDSVPRPVSLPPLPAETVQIDPGIQEVLSAQIAPIQPAIPDLSVLRQDLAVKEKVIQSHLPGSLDDIHKQYEEGLTLIKNGRWQEAKGILQKIEFPEELEADARAKIEILNKLITPTLDSQKKSE